MKRFTSLIMVAGLSLFMAFTACDKKSNPTDPGDGGGGNHDTNNTLACTVSGALNFNFDSPAPGVSYVGENGFVFAGGSESNGVTYTLTITTFVCPAANGTYDIVHPLTRFPDGKAIAVLALPPTVGNLYFSDSGTLTVTSSDDRLIGTFQFTAKEWGRGDAKIQVTGGSFNVFHLK